MTHEELIVLSFVTTLRVRPDVSVAGIVPFALRRDPLDEGGPILGRSNEGPRHWPSQFHQLRGLAQEGICLIGL